jgi:enamine deaminase RidA (YjgF/YER057c/UK114 family)
VSGRTINPPDWPRPRGYANGMISPGRRLHVAGQIGWEPDGSWVATDLPAQFARALDNVLAVVHAAGGVPGDVVSMTVYVTDLDAYRSSVRELGALWRDRFGTHYPAMALVGVAGLVEPRALVEIQAEAALADEEE